MTLAPGRMEGRERQQSGSRETTRKGSCLCWGQPGRRRPCALLAGLLASGLSLKWEYFHETFLIDCSPSRLRLAVEPRATVPHFGTPRFRASAPSGLEREPIQTDHTRASRTDRLSVVSDFSGLGGTFLMTGTGTKFLANKQGEELRLIGQINVEEPDPRTFERQLWA